MQACDEDGWAHWVHEDCLAFYKTEEAAQAAIKFLLLEEAMKDKPGCSIAPEELLGFENKVMLSTSENGSEPREYPMLYIEKQILKG